MKKYIELKNQLKDWAKEIRFYKDHRKLDKRENYTLSFLEYEILKLKWEFRHNHIAYCELRGREYNEIERPSEGNEPDRKFIDKTKQYWKERYENVCPSSERSNEHSASSSSGSCNSGVSS
jgi:hypothetical protein